MQEILLFYYFGFEFYSHVLSFELNLSSHLNDQLMQKAEQFANDIATINATIQYTGLDNNLEYDKWIASDNVDFYH